MRRPPYNPGLRSLVEGNRACAYPLAEEVRKQGFLGWHERGYLPHRDEPGLIQFVTFRLADAFPSELRSEWEALLEIEEDRKRRAELDYYLDLGRGACHLRSVEISGIVENALLLGHGVEYDLRAWVVMPNHVHLLVAVQEVPLSRLVQGWKSFTAREANRILSRRGKFWQDGYWDTYMRDGQHEQCTRRYIENNPVKAKLVGSPLNWSRGSARFRDAYERLCLPNS